MEAVQVRPPVPPDGAVQGRQTTTDFVECYLMHYRRLVRALRLGGADEATAEDLAQEAFARALARWRRVSKGANPPGYVYRTGFRLLQRSSRRSGLEAPSASEPPTPATPAADATAAALVDFEAALDRMPPRRRACAVMCMVVGMSVAEAGEALGIADGTVRKHLEEARSDLRGAWRTGE